ncbi:hypothetical protein EW026_g2933 [Hermanssonia centrifuga]|uniref:Beta-xylosidase C-terminal Concanavalin A-like domain-containing protein n=1 Tax=Hermanssonia centrifuga TaxID=98765 RepID=A0A4S4KLP8_9APHY|nr:hypothetical protein EW026_g2933 [Hermanssonia centrifuga]
MNGTDPPKLTPLLLTGNVVNRPTQVDFTACRIRPTTQNAGGLWAPTIRYHEGTFYVTTTLVFPEKEYGDLSRWQNMLFTTSDPSFNDWSDPILFDYPGYDTSLFWDDDGQVYIREEISQYQIDVRTGRSLSDAPQKIWAGMGGKAPEAPHMYKKNGWYYLLIAEGMVALNSDIARQLQGHGPSGAHSYPALIIHFYDRDPERIRYWVVFLATRVIKDAFPIGRETCLAKVDWSGEWPVVATAALENEEVGGMIDLAKLSAPPEDSEALDVLASPRHHLLYLRNTSLDACNSPYNASNSAQPSILILYSQQITLTDPSKSPTFIGYRQQNLYFESYVQLNITGLADRSEVGLAIYLDHEHHFAACVEKRGGSCRAHVKRVHPDLNSMPDDRDVVNSTPLPIAENATVIRLRVLGEPEKYTFEIDLNPGRTAPGIHPLGFGMAKDVSGGFTGTVVAIYSSHEGSNGSIIFVQEWKYRRM